MLGAIDQKIKDMKRTNCQNANQGYDSYTLCPWNGEVSNIYLPTAEELIQQMIYVNRQSVKIESVKDEFIYSIIGASLRPSSTIVESYSS